MVYEKSPSTATVSFFKVGTKADPSVGDHVGNELFLINTDVDARPLDTIKAKYYPISEEITLAGLPAIKTSFDFYLVKLDDKRVLAIVGEKAGDYLPKILETLEL